MWRRWRHLLMFLLIILKEPNMPEADCSCRPFSRCSCLNRGLSSIPQNLPTSIITLDFRGNLIATLNQSELVLYRDLQGLEMGNSITTLDCLPNLPKLERLDLRENKITNIHPCTFALPSLRTLLLFDNQIRKIPSGTLTNLTLLRQVDLSRNKITTIQSGAFANLPRLTCLDLSFNQITGIQSNLFADLISLEKLMLHNNNITKITSGTFGNQPRLERLSLYSNKITNIQFGTIVNLPQLHTLLLSSNQITTIQAGTFVNLPRLVLFELSKNQISIIQPGAFANLTKLEELYLSNNQIAMMQPDIFANQSQIKQLNLNDNNITTVQEGLFAYLPQIKVLGLSNNQITTILSGTFANLPELIELELYRNIITIVLPGAFANSTRLQKLYLSRNKITTIHPDTFAKLTQLQTLYLTSNKIATIQTGTFADLHHVGALCLTKNQITEVQPGLFANQQRLTDLFLSSNNITEIQHDSFANLTHLKMLFLNRNQIKTIQSGAFAHLPKLQKLYLSYNQINQIFPDTFGNMSRLQHLDLGANQITHIYPDAFANLPLLQFLYLQSNKMSAVFDLSFYFLLPSIRTMNLNSNPWDCDCRMAPFRLNITKYPLFKHQIICTQPAKFKGQKLANVNPDEMICKESTISTPSNNCYNGIVTSRSHWYFKTSKTKPTTPTLLINSNKPESSSSYKPILISSVGGSVCVFVLIGSIVLICYKRMRSQSPLQQSHNVIVSNTNTAVSVQTSSHDNQYEDIDSHHDQPVQGQSRANTQSLKVGSFSHTKVLSALKPNPMYGDAGTLQKDPASTNNHDQTGQDQSQTNTQSLRVGNLSHAEVLAALKPNVMYAGVVTPQKDPQSASDHNQYEDIDNHHDQTGQGQSQAITESDTNAAATVTISGHSLTQDRPITESLDTKRPQCNTLTDFPNSKLNTLYKVAGQYQTITKSDTNTTDAAVTRGHDHQYEDMIQDKKVEQGPSQTITKSNTNATDAEVTSGRVHQCEDMNQHNQIDQGQSHAKTESLDARNFTYGSGPSASQLNSLYAN